MRRQFSRRQSLQLLGAGFCALGLGPFSVAQAPPDPRPTMADGTPLPPVGMGTWITFNVGRDPSLRAARTEVLRAFYAAGGGMVDCSPMYGSSAEVLGHAIQQLGFSNRLFCAEKVWTADADATRSQIEQQRTLWKVPAFDLVQIHNLIGWEAHLENLLEMKHRGAIRYIGITTSHGLRHRELERLVARQPFDFVQLTYNLIQREAEDRLLPLAREKGIAVIANRPYDGGRLIKRLKDDQPLPAWAVSELGCRNWADFLLRFIISHPAVSCAIPATTRADHLRENMGAGAGILPSAAQRRQMVSWLESV